MPDNPKILRDPETREELHLLDCRCVRCEEWRLFLAGKPVEPKPEEKK